MVTLIFPYRNRSIERIKKSLDTLKLQSNQDFQIKFIDYGSKPNFSSEVKSLLQSYAFVDYIYSHSGFQPWNKSRALNIIIKQLETDYCFVADVDMFFAANFIETLHQLKNPESVTYFQVGYLSEEETNKEIHFDQYVPKFLSTYEATGLSLFPVKKLKELKGFDEFFHFWGAEDTDMHHRLRNHGVEINYYDKDILMLHQWHQSFLVKRKRHFNKEFDLDNIVVLNSRHMEANKNMGVTKVNEKGWGKLFSKEVFNRLESHAVDKVLCNTKADMDYLLKSFFVQFENQDKVIQIKAEKLSVLRNLWKKIKGIWMVKHYNMKQVNDLLLTHLITNLRNKNYIYKVSENKREITLKIEL